MVVRNWVVVAMIVYVAGGRLVPGSGGHANLG